MDLFHAIVLDVWRQRGDQAADLRRDLEQRLSELQRRERVLDDAFLYERRIDAATYQRQRDQLREEIAVARISLEDARVEEVDLEGLLRYAEHVLEHAASLWSDTSAERRDGCSRFCSPKDCDW